ncbi:lipoprotein-releasing ABC transporter permease subunit [Bermanella marisrubri]|uniref:ABC-type transport system, involved in lipoprotein release, permease component n=1 Tax=Bermanella marisrubri TaxID=207949 RepID=Q1N4W9_9GAMM|nr:lipoprotein-releasing ABC transporter permease subunit [Bermanella marisrubri]EAT13309.1 ABC-type transport system, involved in lipoprotein release, permease component [Oceanobacter sp. RED65] [Bermanella marisrubri]QIZ84070.1 lipoprotein-releasing ABC transporter permease subunit [Bermanella marisrubri]
MLKNLPIAIGLRYTRAKRRNHFISFISAISMAGLTLGVAVLILVLSVMNGFDRELRQRILGMVPHAAVMGEKQGISNWQDVAAQIADRDDVLATAPFIQIQGMMSYRGRVSGVMVTGIEPEWEERVSILPDFIEQGDFYSLQPGDYGVVMGELLARKLGVTLGDKVTLIMPEASLTPAGLMPRLKRFEVTGVFAVGAEVDANFAYINMQDAARLTRTDGAQGIRLLTDDLFKAPKIVWDLRMDLDGIYGASDWTRTHGNLFQAIKMEKTMIGLLLLIIVAVAAFNIVSTLVMVVTDKQGDIAILRTMGMSQSKIMGVFMVQGSVIGVVGIVVGTLLGILLALTVSDIIAWVEQILGIQFLNANVYFISYLPSELRWMDVVIVTTSGLLLSFLATLYPAYRASKVNPAEALRYDI